MSAYNKMIPLLIFFLSFSMHAQENAVEGVWVTAKNQSKIEIWQDEDQLFYGKIAWLEEESKDKKDVNPSCCIINITN